MKFVYCLRKIQQIVKQSINDQYKTFLNNQTNELRQDLLLTKL